MTAEGHRRARLAGRECLDCGRVAFQAPLATWSLSGQTQLRLPLSQEQLHRRLLQRRATGHPQGLERALHGHSQAGSGHLSLENKKKKILARLERLALVGSASPSRALLGEIAQVTQAAEEVPLGGGLAGPGLFHSVAYLAGLVCIPADSHCKIAGKPFLGWL